MSSLYNTLDPLTEGLLQLFQDEVNARLSEHYDGVTQPIANTQNYPITPQAFSAKRLPLLSLYRETSQGIQAVHFKDTMVRFMATYVAEATGTDEMSRRWPLLNAVSEAMIDALDCDTVAYAGPPMTDFGAQFFSRESVRKKEAFLNSGSRTRPGDIYPSFVMTFSVQARQVEDLTSHLSDFLSMRAKYYVDGWKQEPADLEQDVYTPKGEAVRDAVEPFDEEANP